MNTKAPSSPAQLERDPNTPPQPQQVRLAVVADEPRMRSLVQNLVAGESPVEVSLEWSRVDKMGQAALVSSSRDGERFQGFARRLEVHLPKGRTLYLETERIDWIEAANQYVRLHLANQRYLLRDSLARLGTRLDPRRFRRIHRSAIINLDRVRELQSEAPSQLWVVLGCGQRLKVSQAHREALRHALADLT